jgi:hypothetical protein
MGLAGHCSGLYQEIQDEGAAVAGRGALDFRGGLVALADDAAADRTIVHIGKQPDLTDLFTTANASPHLTIGAAGAGKVTRINDRLMVNSAVQAADMVSLGIGTTVNVLRTLGTRVITISNQSVNQIAAGAAVDLAGLNVSVLQGMAFAGTHTDSVGGGLIGTYNAVGAGAGLSAITNLARYYNANPMTGTVAPGVAVVLEGPNIRAAGLAAGYGYRQADIPTGPVARSLEHGPIGAPWLRMLMSGEWAPAADQTPLYLAEGVVPTLRNVQWMDPGAGGANFVGGERVMVLV